MYPVLSRHTLITNDPKLLIFEPDEVGRVAASGPSNVGARLVLLGCMHGEDMLVSRIAIGEYFV